jgi:hypothetical protein
MHVMKKITVLTLFLLSIAGFASAQTSTSNKSSNTKHVASTSHHSKKSPNKKSTAAKTIDTDNRKEYVKDGQLATPTGHEATPINSDQYQSPRDSSDKKRKKQ